MTTEEMIDKLVADDILTIKFAMMNNDSEYLYHILCDGMGYNSWTDKQIEIEFNERTWEEV
jgi:putative AlgH/UPF0301 family transcriptional regulator